VAGSDISSGTVPSSGESSDESRETSSSSSEIDEFAIGSSGLFVDLRFSYAIELQAELAVSQSKQEIE
jgi:hypothetical protein